MGPPGPAWRSLRPSWDGFGPSWSPLESSWRSLGPSWEPLGAVLERLVAVLGGLGPSWRRLGPSWRHLRPSWAPLGPSWEARGVLRPIVRATPLPWNPSLEGFAPPELHHSYLALSVTWVSTGTERAAQELLRKGSRHRSLLGALAFTTLYVAVRSWEPWRLEPFTAPFALGSLGVTNFVRRRSLLGALAFRAFYGTFRSWGP